MRNYRRLGFLLLALVITVVPIIAGCTSSPAPASPTTAPAAAPKATEPSKPAAPAASPAASSAEKPAAKAPSGDPYKIGFVNSFSGYMAPMGSPERDAVLLLEEKVNSEGGINGRPLKIIAYDDASDESKGVLAIKKLIEQDNVVGIIGTAASGIAMAQVPVVEEAGVPFITMQSARSTVTPFKKWVFKLPLSERFYIEMFYQYAQEKGFKKVGLLTQGAGFGKEAKKYFEETSGAKGLTLVSKEEYGPNDTDMTAQLTKIKGTNPDVLVVYGAEAAGAIAVRQAKEIGIKAPIAGPDSLTMKAIMDVKELRDGLEGLIVMGHKPDSWQQLADTDKQKKIISDFNTLIQKKYGHDLSIWEGNGYDPFMIMVNALNKANPDPTKVTEARGKIRDAIEETKDFVGVSNIVSYSKDDHEIVNAEAGVFNTVEGGKFKLLKAVK